MSNRNLLINESAVSIQDLYVKGLDGQFLQMDGTLVIWGPGGGTGNAITVEDEGSTLTTALALLDFVGIGVTATAVGDNVTVTIPGTYYPIDPTPHIIDYTLSATDGTTLFDASGGNVIATLPTAIGIAGRIYIIKKVDSTDNSVIINTTAAQTIDGAASGVTTLINQNEKIHVQSDGSNWVVL